MPEQEKSDRLFDELSRLVQSMDRLVEALKSSKPDSRRDDEMAPEPLEERGRAAKDAPLQEIQLGYEIDRCSGNLTVKNRYDEWIPVPRGQWVTIDVAIDGNGYWYWRCGGTNEWSRGEPNYRARVKRLKVFHETGGRKITWWCYDLLPAFASK